MMGSLKFEDSLALDPGGNNPLVKPHEIERPRQKKHLLLQANDTSLLREDDSLQILMLFLFN
jgi:hypothetical protein